jgi:glutamine cyclotransferase
VAANLHLSHQVRYYLPGFIFTDEITMKRHLFKISTALKSSVMKLIVILCLSSFSYLGCAAEIPVYSYHIVNTYPHDSKAFTQGLVYDKNNILYESTGLWGHSSLRRLDLATGKVLKLKSLSPKLFGEGLTLWHEQLIQLTWRSQRGFVYQKNNFSLIKDFHYATEGWGITHNKDFLIMSDGSDQLYFLDPPTLIKQYSIKVHSNKTPVTHLNELEYIKGEIFANIWPTDRIARINPHTGEVNSWIKLTGIQPPAANHQTDEVLNGIAYDAKHDRLFVTGKRWPNLFEITLIPLSPP